MLCSPELSEVAASHTCQPCSFPTLLVPRCVLPPSYILPDDSHGFHILMGPCLTQLSGCPCTWVVRIAVPGQGPKQQGQSNMGPDPFSSCHMNLGKLFNFLYFLQPQFPLCAVTVVNDNQITDSVPWTNVEKL